MKINVLILVGLLAFGAIQPAIAAYEPCYLDGRWYEHGTKIGSYVCRHGKWIKTIQ